MIVTLRPNITITDAEQLILLYYSEMGKGVRAYDQAKIDDDNIFTHDQLDEVTHIVNRLGGRIPYKVIESLNDKQLQINTELRSIPAGVSILSGDKTIPWDGFRGLIDTMRVPRLGLAGLTKILHKKRPNIVPILDKIVRNNYLLPLMSKQKMKSLSDGAIAVLYTKELKIDVDSNRATLLEIDAWQGKPYPISILRMLDIFIWCACGPFKDRFAHLIKRN